MGTERKTPKVINQIIEEQILEINRRISTYRNGKPLPDISGPTVILDDDGIATGVTLVPVLKLCRKKNASKIIIASPVSGITYDENLNEADAIEVLLQPEHFYAVAQVYETFGDFTDGELLNLLRLSENE
ncbi:phosphoribosyltransferase family protein [Pedobacter sp. P351]|uniref:phosphoribosyltransferase family protein n=1 Tax=Pedobacter superstes TaxID=3133441 RepID=UPI0030A2C5E6